MIAAIRLFPETLIARLMHLHLVERPLERFSRLERHHLLYLLLIVGMIFAAGELIAIVGSADLALGLAWDLSLYLDAVAVAAVVAVARQAKIAIRLLRARFDLSAALGVRRGKRERRSRARPTGPGKANDDEPAPALIVAA